jgi:hypothetical protein
MMASLGSGFFQSTITLRRKGKIVAMRKFPEVLSTWEVGIKGERLR